MRSLRPRLLTLTLALTAVALLWPRPVQAQGAPQESSRQARDGKFVVRVYEVTDLVVNAPDYEYSQSNERMPGRAQVGGGFLGVNSSSGSDMGNALGVGTDRVLCQFGGGGGMGGGGMGGGGMGFGGMGAMAGPARKSVTPPSVTIVDLMETIINICSANSWTEVGGEGAIEPLGYSLVVSQTEDVHKQIQDLLDQLRKGSGKRKTVTIDARWLLLDSDELEKLTPSDAQVDRQALAEYTRRPTSIRALTNCFSGQQVYLVSGTRQSIVTSVIPVVGSTGQPEDFGAQFAARGSGEGPFMFVSQPGGMGGSAPSFTPSGERSVGYQPVVEKPNFGALLEIRPTLVPDDNAAIVDLRSTITAMGKPTANLAAQPPQALDAPQVDRVAIDTQELATTLNLPLGQPVLVGGLTYVTSSTLAAAGDANSPPTQSAQRETPQLYLILELRTGPGK